MCNYYNIYLYTLKGIQQEYFFIMCSINRNDKMRKTIMKLQKHHRSVRPQKKSGFKVFMKGSVYYMKVHWMTSRFYDHKLTC